MLRLVFPYCPSGNMSGVPPVGLIRSLKKRWYKMQNTNLLKKYESFDVERLLNILNEMNTREGTTATKEEMRAMCNLAREYQLSPVHQFKN